MESAILASLAAILGLVIGRLWDSRLEAVRWRRDQCVRVYENAASAYYKVREAMRVLALTQPGTPEAGTAETTLRMAGAEWNQCMVAVWLHGSVPVAKAVREVDKEIEHLTNRIRSHALTWEQFRIERRPAGRKLDSFIEEIRKELRRPPAPVRIENPAMDYAQ